MSGHSRLVELVPLYALDALDPSEAASLESHLRDCEACRMELDVHRHVAAQLVPDEPPANHVWDRIEAAISQGAEDEVIDFGAERARRRGNPFNWMLATAAVVALVFAGVLVGQRLPFDGLSTDEGVVAAAESAAEEPGAVVGDFLVDDVAVARVVLSEDGLGYVIPTEALDSLDPSRTYQLWVLTPDEVAISAGVLGADPGPATFTWKGDLAGFALTREVAGGVVSSAGDVVSVILGT